MSENYIVINGKKAELTKEQLEKLGIEPDMSKYEEMFKRKLNNDYYFINAGGNLGCVTEECATDDKEYYNVGNYCNDKDVMKQRALHETLNRLLWRASVIAGELDNPWNMSNPHYCIYRDFNSDCLKIDCYDTWKDQGTVYFPTKDSARDAIENIVKPFVKEHPDFVW